MRQLQPIVIGSHGESMPRLLSPGFHSGTLPKAFARLRRLERQAPSFRRFSQRRAWQDVLQHAERDLRRFVERDLHSAAGILSGVERLRIAGWQK